MYRRNSNGYPYISEVAQLAEHVAPAEISLSEVAGSN